VVEDHGGESPPWDNSSLANSDPDKLIKNPGTVSIFGVTKRNNVKRLFIW
jgi:hypothetical protein